MEQANNFRRKIKLAYEQAPWRIETRVGVMLLLVVIIGAALAAFYTDISARTIALGRKIQMMQVSIWNTYTLKYVPDPEEIVPMEELTIEITALRLELAKLNTRALVQQKLDSSGYQVLEGENVIYLPVSGYVPPQTAQIGSFSAPETPQAKQFMPYRDSLLDAFQSGWNSLSDMVQRGILP